jgi:hypothetical protein
MLLIVSLVVFLLVPALLSATAFGPVALLALLACLAYLFTTGDRLAAWSRLHQRQVGGVALELLCGFVTAPSTTQTALTMSTGDSLTLRATDPNKLVRLLAPWTLQQTAGVIRIRSPRLHDNKEGIRLKSVATEPYPLYPLDFSQRLFQNDTLAVDLSGSATGGDIEQAVLPILYDDLAGASARFIAPDELYKRGVNVLGIENTLSTGTAGGWGAAEAINAEYDPMKANTDYALVGYLTDTLAAGIAWRGADTSNYRVGGPGHKNNRMQTRDWFVRLSEFVGVPLIPVFNSNNRGAIQIDCAVDENGADPLVNSIFVELAPK